jgi:hypothetical protein
MQTSNTNICASQTRTADAHLCEASSGMLFLNCQCPLRPGWPTATHSGATKFVRTHPRAAILYTYIENGGEEGIQLVGKPLFTNNTSALILLIQVAILCSAGVLLQLSKLPRITNTSLEGRNGTAGRTLVSIALRATGDAQKRNFLTMLRHTTIRLHSTASLLRCCCVSLD